MYRARSLLFIAHIAMRHKRLGVDRAVKPFSKYRMYGSSIVISSGVPSNDVLEHSGAEIAG